MIRGRTTSWRRYSKESSDGNLLVEFASSLLSRLAAMQLTPRTAGLHKHFRMIAISEQMHNHGFDPVACPHTRIPGIWAKLAEYYDLEAVDERELALIPPEELTGRRRYKEFSL